VLFRGCSPVMNAVGHVRFQTVSLFSMGPVQAVTGTILLAVSRTLASGARCSEASTDGTGHHLPLPESGLIEVVEVGARRMGCRLSTYVSIAMKLSCRVPR